MNFPIDLRFKILALSSQISISGPTGGLVGYAKQKLFKLKEAITIFADEAQTKPLYTINADRWLDFSARYKIADAEGRDLGVVQRRGMRSIWRAHYEVERNGALVFTIREANPWVKVADSFLSELPIIGLFTGHILHPAYKVLSTTGVETMRLTKRPAFFEGKFQLDRLAVVSEEDERLALLSVVMLVLLERRRG